MTITQTVEIPADRRVRFDFEVPFEIPEGQTDVVIQFPIRVKAQPEPAVEFEERGSPPEAEEKPKMYIPKDSNGKFVLTRALIDEMLQNSPHTRALSGILSGIGDVDLNKVRMERLAKHL